MSAPHLLDQLPVLLNQGTWLVVIIFAVCGLAMAYSGLKVYWIGIFLSGMIPGAMFGAAAAVAMKWSQAGVVFLSVFSALCSGTLAVYLTILAVFLIGALAAGVVCVLAGVSEPWIILLAAFIGGIIAVNLQQIAIVLGTAITGAGMLLFSFININAMIQNGHPAILPGDFLAYFFRLGNIAWQNGNLDSAYRVAGTDFLVFLFFFVTGVTVQFSFHRILKILHSGPAEKSDLPTHSSKPQANYSPQNKRFKSLPKQWQLSLFENGIHQQSIPLCEGCWTLGRDPETDICIENQAISRRHLVVLVSKRGEVRVTDTESSNGTWKFGKERIKQDTPKERDWYQLGTVQLVFHRV